MLSANTPVCFASKQPILAGSACRILPIQQQVSANPVSCSLKGIRYTVHGVCADPASVSANWTPVGAAFEAVYENNGIATLVYSTLAQHNLLGFFHYLLSYGVTAAPGANPLREMEFNLADFIEYKTPNLDHALRTRQIPNAEDTDTITLWRESLQCWSYIWTASQQQRIFCGNTPLAIRPFNFAVVHEAAYAELILRYSISGQSARLNTASLEHQFIDAVIKAEADMSASLPASASVSTGSAWALMSLLHRSTKQLTYSKLDATLRLCQDSTMLVTSFLAFIKREISAAELYQQALPTLQLHYFIAGLELLGIQLAPVAYVSGTAGTAQALAYSDFIATLRAQATGSPYVASR